jgi:hypothetical protein
MGQFSAGPFYVDSLADGRRDFDISSEIGELQMDNMKWMSIMMKSRKVPAKTTKYTWYDQGALSYVTQINHGAGYNDGVDTTFTVDDGTIFAQYDIFKNPRTGELFRVVSSTATTVTVSARPFGGTGTAILDNDYLIRVGNAMAENSSAPASKLVQPSEFYNVTQIFRTVFDASASQEAEDIKTSPTERIRLRKIKGREHKLDINRAFWFGVRVNDTTNHIRASGGVIPRLTTNTLNVGGVLTQTVLNDFLADIFTYGSGSKALIASPVIIGAISNMALGKLVVSEGAKKYGLNIPTYISPFGELDLYLDNTFSGYYAGYGAILDIQDVYYRPLKGRDTKFRQDIQAPDVDGWKDEYITEVGFQLRNEPAHGLIYGVTA